MFESEVVCGLEMNLQLISRVNHWCWPVNRIENGILTSGNIEYCGLG